MKDIFLQNTLSGKKDKFTSITPNQVLMYNCGPTVYNYAHLGNLRSYVFADVLRRMFEYNGYEIKQVINITDIGHLSSDNDDGEDKMTKALKREGKPLTLPAMREVANFYFDKFKEDLLALNIELPSEFPFASDNIQEDIELIKKLGENGFTYTTSDGLYFDTDKFPEYGKLGNIRSVDESHSRIGANPEKRNQKDFALWKFNNEMGYETPFGKGFPGWHIECTAMSVKYLGKEFDIHTGGIDHIPVHHNNEIAQAEGAGYPFARYWMHNAFLTVESGKMAKSEENFITLNTLKEKSIDPLAYRYLLLSGQYSSPLQFSWEALEGAQTAWKKLKEKISLLSVDIKPDSENIEKYRNEFSEYINDDLNTPRALSLVWEVLKDQSLGEADKKEMVLRFDKVLGLQLNKHEEFEIPENVKVLINERNEARNDKNFEKSDELRKEIEKLGYEIKDTPEGTNVSPV
ncbi:cysteine--tRNA ligase [Patescibacteria group bacterium]|nr:cysteine--tRNA ligase [Patescibacteria group bacterium]